MDYDVRDRGQCGDVCQVGKKKHKPRKPKAAGHKSTPCGAQAIFEGRSAFDKEAVL